MRIKYAILAAGLCLVALGGCQTGAPSFTAASTAPATSTAAALPASTASPTPPPTETAQPSPARSFTVTIHPSVQAQVIGEVAGGNFIHHFNQIETAADPISDYSLKMLAPRAVRVDLDLEDWEPFPGKTGEGRFREKPHNAGIFAFLQEVKRQVPDGVIVASMWQVPDWMASNSKTIGRTIDPAEYDHLAESITQWLLRARDEYGVEVDYVSFNEANGGINVLLTPEEYIAIIHASGERFAGAGLKTRWLIGDASNVGEALAYGRAIWQVEETRQYLGPFTFHSWPPDPPGALDEIGRFARETGLEVWCTETGWDQYQGGRPFEFSTWMHAVKLADVYTRVIGQARASNLFYWAMMGGNFNITDGSESFPAMIYLQELQKRLPAGSRVTGVTVDPLASAGASALAAKTPGGGMVVEVVNLAAERKITLAGLPAGEYEVLILSEATGGKELVTLQAGGGEVELDMPAESILFLTQL